MQNSEEKRFGRTTRTGALREKRPARPPRRILDGVLLIDKPVGLSSHDALLRAKGMLRAKKAGHTGTLDPLASGLLPLCFGEATKFSQDLLDADKFYDATMRLGERTDTGDAEGAIIETRSVICDIETIDSVIARFRGEIQQVPPMYSAIKRDGKPLYEYARAGQTVERDARWVTIHALDRLSDETALKDRSEVSIRVHCSKGTYIRTLAEDIGEQLGCGAHLTALRRTRVGNLSLDDAYSLDALQQRLNNELPPQPQPQPLPLQPQQPQPRQEAEESLQGVPESEAVPTLPTVAIVPALDPAGLMQPIDALLGSFPAVQLSEEYGRRFLHGQRLRLSADAAMRWPEDRPPVDPATASIGRVRVYNSANRLMGTATLEGGLLAPERLIANGD